MDRIGQLLVAFVVLAVVFWLLERAFADRPRGARREGLATDIGYWLFTPLVTASVTRIAVAIVLLPLLWLLGRPLDPELLRHGYGPVAQWPAAVQVPLVIVLGDFIGYWVHRAFHAPALWRFHAVHHGSTTLDWLSAVRVHPVNDLVARICQAVPFVAIGFAPVVVAAYLPLLTLYAIFLHANLRFDFGPLRYVLASPRFHRWHHTGEAEGRDRNFAGLLPLWDLVFGTYYLPRGRGPERFGVDEPIPAGLLGQLAYPFRRRGDVGSRLAPG